MTRQAKQFTYAITAFLIALFVIFSLITGGGAQLASAAASPYSDVLEDLRTDGNFTVDEFPVIERNYSLNVIQIAESTDDELLIYVYQPAADTTVKASSINIAREFDNSVGLSPKNYPLEYLNANGVFFKYRVLDFELKNDAIRYYNIINILRPFDKIIDDLPADGQTVSEVQNPVGQFWTACTVGGNVTYSMTESEVIEITEKYVGFVNYDDGVNFGWISTNSATSAHFVAFSTDKPIDKLISASVSFNERNVTYQLCGNLTHTNALNGHSYKSKFNYVHGEQTKHEPVIKYGEKGSNDGGGNLRPANKYTWNRIRSTKEFLADENNSEYKLTSSPEGSISSTQWVLNFYETPIEAKSNGSDWAVAINGFAALLNGVMDIDCRYTEVSDVMILRLEFETDGQHYNLGAVDNKQTGSQKPVNEPVGSGCAASWEWLNALPAWAWCIIFPAGVVVAVLLVLLIARLVTLPFRKLSERRTQTAATSVKRPKSKHIRGATGKRKPKTTKKKGGKK